MLIGEALAEVKLLQSKLIRLQTMRQDLFKVLKGHEPEGYSYESLTSEINNVHSNINKLKVAIQRTNVSKKLQVKLPSGEKEMTIMEGILEISRIRSELEQYDYLVPTTAEAQYGREAIVEYFFPITQQERDEIIERLEAEKRCYDLALQGANWTTELVG